MEGLLKHISWKNITNILIRLVIFVIPLLILIAIMEFMPPHREPDIGYTDRGLGFAILAGIWAIIYTIFLIIETVYFILKKRVFGIVILSYYFYSYLRLSFFN